MSAYRAQAATPTRRAAFELLRRVFEHDAWADRAFPAAAERHELTGRDRAQAQRLAYGAVQRRGTSDHVAAQLARRKVSSLDPPVVAALRLGLFEILFSSAAGHAVVDGAVELAKGGMRGERRSAGAGGLVNAVLRRAVAERDELLESLTDESPADAAIAHSVPEWLAKLWWDELGAESARSLLAAMNEPSETAMRVNTLRGDPAAVRADLEAAGEPIAPSPQVGPLDPPEALVWDGPLGEAAIDALRSGWMFAQSRGAQAVIGVLGALPGERVLDLCAGPGVKTVAIAAQVGGEGEVVAVELDPRRARQVEVMARRADAHSVRVVAADATSTGEPRKKFVGPEQGYDRVLVDPPCSDLGTLASRPDARWRKDPATIERVVAQQTQILDTGVELLRPGGTLVYSTCTISKRENEDVVAGALASHAGIREVRRVETRPDRDGTDGFFIAELVREKRGG